MAQNQLIDSLSILSKKIEDLLKRQTMLHKRIEELEKRNNELEEQRQKDLKIIEKANQDIEFLTVSHKLAESPDTIISTRRKILGLIRTIDNCIRIIKEE